MLTHTQTDRQTKSGKNITSVAEVIIFPCVRQPLNMTRIFCIWLLMWLYMVDPAVAVECPFRDAYYFNYADAVHGKCRQALSYAKPCVAATRYQLHFKHCQPTASMHATG